MLSKMLNSLSFRLANGLKEGAVRKINYKGGPIAGLVSTNTIFCGFNFLSENGPLELLFNLHNVMGTVRC